MPGTAAAERRAEPPARPVGRPSRERASLLVGHIVEVATALFLTAGFEATSIEDVARRAGISKRTFYSRFPDKAALFRAVVHAVLQGLRPADTDALFIPGPPKEVLARLAGAILKAALDPTALALHRLTIAESGRFPDVAAAVAGEGAAEEAVRRISALLVSLAGGREIGQGEAEFASVQFLQMIVSVPQRQALKGDPPMSAAEREAWVRRSVALFLGGWAS